MLASLRSRQVSLLLRSAAAASSTRRQLAGGKIGCEGSLHASTRRQLVHGALLQRNGACVAEQQSCCIRLAPGASVIARCKHSAHRSKRDLADKNDGTGSKGGKGAGGRDHATAPPATPVAAQARAAEASGGRDNYADDEGASVESTAPATLDELADLSSVKARFDRVLSGLSADFRALRGGRVEAGMLDHVAVDAYGSAVPLSEVAQVAIKAPHMLAVTVFDPAIADAVCAAIRDCGMNLNPTVDGNRVSVPVPKPSQETRDNLVKVAAKEAEKAKVHIRGIRHKVMERLKKHKDAFPSDDVHRREKAVDAATAAAVDAATKVLEQKRKEILL